MATVGFFSNSIDKAYLNMKKRTDFDIKDCTMHLCMSFLHHSVLGKQRLTAEVMLGQEWTRSRRRRQEEGLSKIIHIQYTVSETIAPKCLENWFLPPFHSGGRMKTPSNAPFSLFTNYSILDTGNTVRMLSLREMLFLQFLLPLWGCQCFCLLYLLRPVRDCQTVFSVALQLQQ